MNTEAIAFRVREKRGRLKQIRRFFQIVENLEELGEASLIQRFADHHLRAE